MTEPSTYGMISCRFLKRNKKLPCSNGSAVNIWQLLNLLTRSYFHIWNLKTFKQKHVICWQLSRQHIGFFLQMPSTNEILLFMFLKIKINHMLMAQHMTIFKLVECWRLTGNFKTDQKSTFSQNFTCGSTHDRVSSSRLFLRAHYKSHVAFIYFLWSCLVHVLQLIIEPCAW